MSATATRDLVLKAIEQHESADYLVRDMPSEDAVDETTRAWHTVCECGWQIYGQNGKAWSEHRAEAVLAALADTQAPSPTTWSLPPEPGPEVTAVRDRRSDMHLRIETGWVLRGSPMHKAGIGITWKNTVIRFGPLTDATSEST